jgi:hypothetical protein
MKSNHGSHELPLTDITNEEDRGFLGAERPIRRLVVAAAAGVLVVGMAVGGLVNALESAPRPASAPAATSAPENSSQPDDAVLLPQRPASSYPSTDKTAGL